MGYVTEVKDQVRHSYVHFERVFIQIGSWTPLNLLYVLNVLHRVTVAHAGPSALRELLRDKYTRGQASLYLWVNKTWSTAPNLTVPMAATVPGWPTPTTTWSTTGWRRQAAIRTPQWWGSPRWPRLKTVHYSASSLTLTFRSVFFSTGYPALSLRQQTCSCSYQRLQVHTQRRWAGSGWCRGDHWSNHSSHWCRSCKLPVLQLRLIVLKYPLDTIVMSACRYQYFHTNNGVRNRWFMMN